MNAFKLLLLFFALSLNALATIKTAIVKANIIRGEGFVTVKSDPLEIEQIFKLAFEEKGYKVVSDALTDKDILYVDLFVFQHPTDYPTITVTIRSRRGIHSIDSENIQLFMGREVAIIKVAKLLAQRIPVVINTDVYYNPLLTDILSKRRISLTGAVTNSIIEGYQANYTSVIQWSNSEPPTFAFPNEFESYLMYCSNFQGLRKEIKGHPISVILKINKGARFEIVRIDSPFELNEKQKETIQSIIDAFPLWVVDSEMNDIELRLGIK